MSAASLEVIPVAAPGTGPAFVHLGYRPCLDGLRAFAVLVVMAHHAYIPFFRGGAIGVDIFFVLSGFLITSLLLEEWRKTSNVSLKKFYIRRILRLFPALVLFLAFIQGYSVIFLRGPRLWDMEKSIAAVLLYVGNWLRAFELVDMTVLSHTWSLSIEEQFYLIWPVVLLLLLRAGKNERWILGALGLVITLLAIRRSWMWDGMASAARIYNGSDTRFDELLAGCATAVLQRVGGFPWARARKGLRYLVWPAILVVVVVIVRPLTVKTMYTVGWPVLELAVGVIVLGLISGAAEPVQRVMELRPAVWIGKLSYGLYLWHVPIVGRAGGWHSLGIFRAPVGIALTFLVAAASYYAVESGFLKLKHRFSATESSDRDRRSSRLHHHASFTTTVRLLYVSTIVSALSAWLFRALEGIRTFCLRFLWVKRSTGPDAIIPDSLLDVTGESQDPVQQAARRPPQQSPDSGKTGVS